jgi:ectoine hydroxylase-related dioxygenase (phytanoyl-CoA dioxygenase family)
VDEDREPKREAEQHARALLERGYTVVPGTHSSAQIGRFRAALERTHHAYGAPVPYAAETRALADTVMVNPTGFIVTKLLAVWPELAAELISPQVVEVVRQLFGAEPTLELTGANLSDARRPFFSWHNHIGGIDVEDYRVRAEYPSFRRSDRVIAVTYLDDIDESGGELRVLPRAITDPTPPPHDLFVDRWPGQERLRFAAGSTLIFEQCTWHSVMPKSSAGQRMFVGAYFKAPYAPPTVAVDDSLLAYTGDDPLLRSLLPGGSQPQPA